MGEGVGGFGVSGIESVHTGKGVFILQQREKWPVSSSASAKRKLELNKQTNCPAWKSTIH